jgi:hypothetical protein
MLTLNEFKTDYHTLKEELNSDYNTIERVINNCTEYLTYKFPETKGIFQKFDETAIKEVKQIKIIMIVC